MAMPVFEQLYEPVDRILELADIAQIDRQAAFTNVILTGGSSQIPWLHNWVKEEFGEAAFEPPFNPITAVA